VEALHRRHGILSISEMSRLSVVSRQDIYRIYFNHGPKGAESLSSVILLLFFAHDD
jgi:hypothetical protein